MHLTLTTLIVGLLPLQLMPVAIGINARGGIVKSVWFGLLLLIGQLVLFIAGYFLGNRFMHLLENYAGTIIFAGFFLIGVRLIMEAFKVRKGERTFISDTTATVSLASLAQGINTFLAGILITAMVDSMEPFLLILLITSVVTISLGVILKPGRQSFGFASLLYLASGIVFIIGSVYLGFWV